MKYVFVAGLEHSGTTLTDHLLSQHPRVLGLGEVASFFSPAHMKNYMERWGKYPDARLCSCGQAWDDCPFWSEIMELNGLNTDWPIQNKYGHLFSYIKSECKDVNVVVDSSKNIHVLDTLVRNIDVTTLKKDDIFAIFVVKDVRGFAASIAKKTQKTSLFSQLKTFNLWHQSHKKILESLHNADITSTTVLYEKLCLDTDLTVGSILNRLGLSLETNIHPLQNTSHIAMGNKDFAMRNKERVRYDSSWFLNDTINLTYLVHRKVRAFNRNLYME